MASALKLLVTIALVGAAVVLLGCMLQVTGLVPLQQLQRTIGVGFMIGGCAYLLAGLVYVVWVRGLAVRLPARVREAVALQGFARVAPWSRLIAVLGQDDGAPDKDAAVSLARWRTIGVVVGGLLVLGWATLGSTVFASGGAQTKARASLAIAVLGVLWVLLLVSHLAMLRAIERIMVPPTGASGGSGA